ncbi:D-alanyl-D-alanine carboxypeptidase family protein [Actinomadura sp. SCN-SB]|uniref:M15 family metallopeptidase n=1 Tax=Actinomadura sp. SCN-SB TaxID=3373092 RepID=UPI003751FE87
MHKRHGKNGKIAAPVTGVVLAGILAGALGLTSVTTAPKESTTTAGDLALSANRAKKSATPRDTTRSRNSPAAKATPSPDTKPKAKSRAHPSAKPSAKPPAGPPVPPAKPPTTCDASQKRKVGRFPNGRIPTRYLCPLPQRGLVLRSDAASAFYELNTAYKKRFGSDICLRNSYRSFAKQKDLYESMPAGMAAEPGNSKHGLGIAADFCGGVEDDESPQFKWMRANSEKYDWLHPDWAYSSPYEPWHWEFDVGQND